MKKINQKRQSGFKIGIYVRVSTEEQAENPEGSIKNQEMRLRDFIKLKNHDSNFGEVAEVFCDPGISAKNMNRPQLQKMLQKIKTGEINLVLVTELSRLTRSTKDFSILWEFMDNHGCKFLSLRDNFDSTTPAGEMIMFTLANFAQFERKQTAERIANAFQARSKRGLWNGGVLPLGYDVDKSKPGHLMVVTSEAEIVRAVFDTFLKEETLSRTGKSLNDKKIELPRKLRNGGGYRSSHFKIDSVHRILKNKAYIGIREYKTKEGFLETNAAWPAIIDPIKFDRVQKLLAKNRYSKKPPSKERYPYTLSGILFCKKCGDRLCGKSAHGNGGKIGYYEHAWSTKSQACLSKKVFTCEPNRILAKKIEPVVWQDVKRLLLDETYRRQLFTEAQGLKQDQTATRTVEKLKSKLASIDYQIEATAERVSTLPKEMDAKPIYDQILRLQKTKSDLDLELLTAKASAQTKEEPICVDSFEAFTDTLKEIIRKEERPDAMAAIIRKLLQKIEVTESGIIIHYHVGENHFVREFNEELGSDTLNSSPKNQTGLVNLTRPVSKSLLKYKSSNFFHDAGSNSLKIGRGAGTRTPDPSVMSRLL